VDDELEEVRAFLGEQPLLPASTEKQDRIKERKGTRRRRQEDSKNKTNKEQDPEGWSSDEEGNYLDEYKKIREITEGVSTT